MKSSKFKITGMTCAACQANVTKCALKLDGTKNADVNLLSGSMVVEYDESKLTEQDFIFAVNNIGYGATIYGNNNKKSLSSEWEERKKDFKSHQEFWIPKIERNMERDAEVTARLESEGWTVIRFWGNEIKKNTAQCADIIEKAVHST